MTDCLKFCCKKNNVKKRKPLTTTSQCVVSAGIHRNVDIEVDEFCRLISVKPAEKEIHYLCSPCEANND